ncbi:MAG: ATP-binding cassette domain-containing protein [Pirellulaceae bacterium]|jgi:ATP-binding cassette subfamily F protein uup|nr:ATP-binding cassette domain-containing protein [Pirellulaceae bacterium]
MPLVTISDLSIGFRGPPLLDQVRCRIEPLERIGLLGRNGAGKTTLLRILSGEEQPDAGEVRMDRRTRVALLSQEVPVGLQGSVAEVVDQGLADACDEHGEPLPDWRKEQSVEQTLSRMSLDGGDSFATLSSGMKRRVLLAQALVSDPDLLLLDEPTNHLDIDSILWLEGFLKKWNAALLFVTHDRMFLQKLADRILEIDRGQLFDWTCDFDTFLQRKEAALEVEEKQNALFDKKLAQEEAWIRQGIKARRTRNEGRVRALKRLREERRERQSAPGKVNLLIDEGARSGALVAELKSVSFSYDDNQIVRDFSTTIMRGDKIGVIGPNGIGKTTLLRILLGQLEPQDGKVRLGTNLQVAYFDQLRHQLDEEQTVQENVGDGGDTVQIGGRSKHVIGYLQEFLFSPERARTPVRFLSGGERNRVLLARLFARPANVIVLDEPTNDLDAETLEMLEERLVAYEGTLLLVSHDRTFLNNVVTSSIVFESSDVKEYVGGYDDWLRQRPANTAEKAPSSVKPRSKATEVEPAKRRLSFRERRELEELPATIEQIEKQISELHEAMAQAEFFTQSSDEIAAAGKRLRSLEDQLTSAVERWEELEERA